MTDQERTKPQHELIGQIRLGNIQQDVAAQSKQQSDTDPAPVGVGGCSAQPEDQGDDRNALGCQTQSGRIDVVTVDKNQSADQGQ